MQFGRFTPRAQKVLALSQEQAIRLKNNTMNTEHILLAIIEESKGNACKAMYDLGVNTETLKERIEEKVEADEPTEASLQYSVRAKKIIELAMDEAQALNHSHIGTEHLFLALVVEGEGIASRVLNNADISLKKARNAVLKALGEDKQLRTNTFHQKTKTTSNQKKTPNLDKLATDMTQLAEDGKIDKVIGRSQEIRRIVQILCRRGKNNPVLTASPGVGKTAIVEGIARAIVERETPDVLFDKRIMSLNMGTLVAGTKYRGEFEERINKLVAEVKDHGNIILFIDEIHTLIGAGGAEGAVDAANILKPELARGDIQIIGATTLDEYQKYIEKDKAIERRFQPVSIDEPTVDEAIQIIQGIASQYEEHHKVTIPEHTISQAVQLSHRYINDRFLPDKAIDLIDEASSKVRLDATSVPEHIRSLEKELIRIQEEKDDKINEQEFQRASELREEENKQALTLREMTDVWNEKTDKESVVTEEDVAEVVSMWTGVPVTQLTEKESARLLDMESVLHERVVGQDEAITAVSKAIRRSRAGLGNESKPIGNFLFVGPTATGKSETAKAIAEAMFGSEDAMIRLDMSEYNDGHSVSRLIGASPGFIGYESSGQLTEKVRRNPYSVILLDEIEKSHSDIYNILLSIMDEGRISDAKGRHVNFKNTVIIMTSNVGSSFLGQTKTVGFSGQSEEVKNENNRHIVESELAKTFKPEFLNRIDEVVTFHSLGKEHIKEIVYLVAGRVIERVKRAGIHLDITEEAYTKLSELGYDPKFGGRPIRRAVQKHIEDKLSDEVLKGEIGDGSHVLIDVVDDEFTVEKKDTELV